MVTNQESRFLDIVPVRLTDIRNHISHIAPRLVKVKNPATYINPAQIISVCELPEEMSDNKQGGRVNIGMANDDVFETFFKTAAEALKALGME